MLSNAPVAGVVKLIDFGLSLPLPPGGGLLPPGPRGACAAVWSLLQNRSSVMHAPSSFAVGKERYMSPEMYAQGPCSGPALDMWTIGMCVFVLLFGIYPYSCASAARCQCVGAAAAALANAPHSQPPPPPMHCRYFAEIAGGRFLPMLVAWGYDRAVSPEALDLLNGLICPNPQARLSMAQVEAHAWFRPLLVGAAAPVAPVAPAGGPGGGGPGGHA